MPVDAFFSSLAAERKSQAIAVVLSGTDGDGALGLEEVKAAGGITFAQCEATAEFQGTEHGGGNGASRFYSASPGDRRRAN